MCGLKRKKKIAKDNGESDAIDQKSFVWIEEKRRHT